MMKTAIELAMEAAERADILDRPTDPRDEYRFALLWAEIAQAEALGRIAAVLEFSDQGRLARCIDRARRLGIGTPREVWGLDGDQ